MSESIVTGPFGSYEPNTMGGMLNLLHGQGVPLTTVENLNFDFTKKEITYDGLPFAMFKSFDGIEKPLFFFQNQNFGRQQAAWDEDGKLVPKFHLSLYHHGHSSLVITKQRDCQLFNKELYEFITKMMVANISHVTEDSSDYMKELNEMYLVKNASGAFFQGGSGGMDKEYIYIEFWKPAGAQAFVDYINNNFKYETIVKPPEMMMGD